MSTIPRGAAIFMADAPALDFLNSIATPIDSEIDWIADGNGLLDWLKQADWIELTILTEIETETTAEGLDEIAAQARALRTWFREFVSKYKGKTLPAKAIGDLAALNALLERDNKFTQVEVSAGEQTQFQTTLRRRRYTPSSVLVPIGEILADFICSESFTDIKSCEGANCTLMFIDHTRGKKRRWCSMAVCGNRAKAAAHRQRKKGNE
jgi:predicted RNA-binding Zn ribbon-like protein